MQVRWLGVALSMAVAASLAGVPSAPSPPSPVGPSPGDVLAEFVPSGATGNGRGMAFDGTSLYYTLVDREHDDSNIYKITTSGTALTTIPVAGGVSAGGPLTWDGTALWTLDYAENSFTLYRVDPADGSILGSCDIRAANPSHPAVTDSPFNLGYLPDGLHWSGSSLWISSEVTPGNWVAEVDTSCRILRAFHTPDPFSFNSGTSGIAYVGGLLWHVAATHESTKYFQTNLSGDVVGTSFTARHVDEDIEFDGVTFAPDCALWADASEAPNYITAYAVPCPVPPNAPPVAAAGGPYEGIEGQAVAFNASGSTDADGDALQFAWDWDADGVMDAPWGSAPTASHLWGDDLDGVVSVHVTDGEANATANATVRIRNAAPEVTVIVPPAEEGEAIAAVAHITDPGSDDLTVAWWGICHGWSGMATLYNDPSLGPDPPNSTDLHPRDTRYSQTPDCGDDGALWFHLEVRDDDGGLITVLGDAQVANLEPGFTVTLCPQIVGCAAERDEGAVTGYFADVVDPGSDDLALDWSWGDGTPGESGTHFNDGTAPDPSASPNGTYPFAVMEARTHAFGDDGGYPITVTAADDDTGAVAYMSIVTIRNVAPTLDLFALPDSDEGSVLPFTAGFSDPGFDVPSAGTMEDFTAAVDWGDGIVEALAVLEFPGGPGVATTGALQGSHVYADDGTYAATLTVCDDDGGCGSATDTVHVRNVVPAVDAGPDLSIDEAGTAAITATFFDPGFDFAPAGTLEDFTATVSWELRSTQATAVTEVPGSAGILTTGSLTASEAYGDNGVYVVTVTVCDDDGGCGSDTATLTVGNVAPTIEDVQIYAAADITLRVAGEKFHDVCLELTTNGAVTGAACVVRMPGSPDRQTATISGGKIQLLGDTAITLYYTPDDDPINGQRNGDNPAWVILTFADGSEVRLHHNFNVQHPGTWTRTIDDLRVHLLGKPITFEVAASDVGSDDLRVDTDFGDGGMFTATVFNDRMGPDAFPSPEVNPITAGVTGHHAYGVAGAYVVTVTIRDDDGGSVAATWLVVVG